MTFETANRPKNLEVMARLTDTLFNELDISKVPYSVKEMTGVDVNVDHVWHGTRISEYPYVLEVAAPIGRVLDMGSNDQFSVAISAMVEMTHLTIHHTWQDYHNIGMAYCKEFGLLPMKEFARRNRKRVDMVVCDPSEISCPDNFYDVVYLTSVVEHLDNESDVGEWLSVAKRLLRPGGILAVTCDWWAGEKAGFGYPGMMNWDLSSHFSIADIFSGSEDVPWRDSEAYLRMSDPDVLKLPDIDRRIDNSKKEVKRFTVYGFAWRKPGV